MNQQKDFPVLASNTKTKENNNSPFPFNPQKDVLVADLSNIHNN